MQEPIPPAPTSTAASDPLSLGSPLEHGASSLLTLLYRGEPTVAEKLGQGLEGKERLGPRVLRALVTRHWTRVS